MGGSLWWAYSMSPLYGDSPRAMMESIVLMVRRGSPAATGRGGMGRPTCNIHVYGNKFLRQQFVKQIFEFFKTLEFPRMCQQIKKN